MSDWRNDLSSFFKKSTESREQEERPEFVRFVSDIVVPAFQKLAGELEKHGRTVTIRESGTSAALLVHHDGREEFMYRIHGRTFPNVVLPCAEMRFRERKGLKLIHMENMLRSGPPNYTLSDIGEAEIIQNFLGNYTSRVGND